MCFLVERYWLWWVGCWHKYILWYFKFSWYGPLNHCSLCMYPSLGQPEPDELASSPLKTESKPTRFSYRWFWFPEERSFLFYSFQDSPALPFVICNVEFGHWVVSKLYKKKLASSLTKNIIRVCYKGQSVNLSVTKKKLHYI